MCTSVEEIEKEWLFECICWPGRPSAGPVNVCSGSDLYFAEGAGLLCLLFGGGEGESLSVSFSLHPLPI